MRMDLRPTLLVIIALSLGCAPTPRVDAAADEKAIRDIDTSWNEWLTARNDSAIAEIYGDGAVLLPPNLPRVSGAASIRQFWAALWPLNASLSLTPISVRVDATGVLAVEEGSYAFAMPEMPNDAGKYIVVWQKQSGRWKAIQDIWNSDTPPPATPATQPR